MRGQFQHIPALIAAVKEKKLTDHAKVPRFIYGEQPGYDPVNNVFMLPGEPDSNMGRAEFNELLFLSIHEGKCESELSTWDPQDPRWVNNDDLRIMVNSLNDARIDTLACNMFPGYEIAANEFYQTQRDEFMENTPACVFWNLAVVLKLHLFNGHDTWVDEIRTRFKDTKWPKVIDMALECIPDDYDMLDEEQAINLAIKIFETFFPDWEPPQADEPEKGPTGEKGDGEEEEGEESESTGDGDETGEEEGESREGTEGDGEGPSGGPGDGEKPADEDEQKEGLVNAEDNLTAETDDINHNVSVENKTLKEELFDEVKEDDRSKNWDELANSKLGKLKSQEKQGVFYAPAFQPRISIYCDDPQAFRHVYLNADGSLPRIISPDRKKIREKADEMIKKTRKGGWG